jgi:glycosyltransferase involved in cell wall biosynthesis
MKISIVTVCFNCADTIGDTLDSVLGQAHENIEYIVVDGGSSDGTQTVVGKYNGGVRKFISEPDAGIYDAMNKGIRMAEGDFIGFLNADDIYVDGTVISDLVTAAEADGVDAVYGDLLYVRRDDTDKVVRYWKTGEYLPGAFRLGWVPPHPTFFCRRGLLEEFGCFDPLYRIAGDFELMLRLIEKHKVAVGYVARPLVKMRVGGRANTIRGMWCGNREILRAFAANGIRPSPSFFLRKPLTKLGQLHKRPAPSSLSRSEPRPVASAERV